MRFLSTRFLSWRSFFNPHSLAGRLFLAAIVFSASVLVLAGLTLSTINRHSIEAGFDERLKLYLKVLVADVASLGEGNAVEPGNLGEPQFQIPLSGWYWQILRQDAEKDTYTLLRSSRSLFSHRLPLLKECYPSASVSDFRDGSCQGPEGKKLRMIEQEIDLGEQNHFLIVVAGNDEEINEDSRKFDLTLTIILTVLALALAFSSFLQVRYGLTPLTRLSDALVDIRQGHKDHIEGNFPEEIAPLAHQLNLVLEANRDIVARARGQVGNLAHGLKTPLSVLLNEARQDKTPLAEKLREQCEIMRDQVQHYLDRARAAARAVAIGHVTEIEPAIAVFIRAFEKIYRDRDLVFEAEIEAGARFRGEKQDFDDMVGNLLDNAGKWAKSRVFIQVSYIREDGREHAEKICVHVDDDGVGLDENACKLALERGRRFDETKPGSGLGLSIVLDLATLYSGRFLLDSSPLGGLRATLILPAA